MNDIEIAQEILHNSRWLDDDYKNTNYYKEYLKLVFEELN
jgi:hypothetical protein